MEDKVVVGRFVSQRIFMAVLCKWMELNLKPLLGYSNHFMLFTKKMDGMESVKHRGCWENFGPKMDLGFSRSPTEELDHNFLCPSKKMDLVPI